MERIISVLKEYGVLVGVGVVGIGMLGYGLWGVLWPEPARVEIVKSDTVTQCHDEQCEPQSIYVDVAGAVERPGVYKLPEKSRIEDVLVLAGGLAANADREWVAQNLNLAKEVKDGEKVYVPAIQQIGESASRQISGSVNQKIGKININTASQSELDSLEGIGEARVQAIIANRPYGSIEELVSKAKIPQSLYEKIKDEITVY